MNRIQITLLASMMLMGTAMFCACSGSKNNSDNPAPKPVVQLSNSATLGSYLTDGSGNTLYYFSNDFNGSNNCSGGCAAVWPVYYAGATLTQAMLGTGLDIKDFTTITTSDGKQQTAYKGWPLYYFAPAVNGSNVREAPGETKGEAVGNVWFVAKPDYTIQLINAQLVGADGKNYLSNYTPGSGKTLYFTDGKGATLYVFSKDSINTNKFTKPDFSNNAVWPIYETDQIVVPSVLDKTQFGSIMVYGKKQLTYKGSPLYYFGQDAGMRGSNKGVSVPMPGVWPVAVK
jgi:predicted lipoprotein with Yx(FWY)xxD motif